MDISNRAQYRAWQFTLNGSHNFDDLNAVQDWQYMIAGKEVAETGTKHLQGYVYFNKRKTFAACKKMIPNAHFEPAKGSPESNENYCSKEGEFFEAGELPDILGGSSGGKKKAERFRAMINLAQSDQFDDIVEIDPVSYVQHYHSFKRIKQDHPKKIKNLDDVCGEWIYGEPGAGKSFLARKENEDLYDKPANKWWDGYQNETAVLIDDFDKVHAVLGHHLKRWADRYSFPAEMKGTTVQIRPLKIIVTSNYSIEEIFGYEDVLCAAIKRRFKQRHLIKPTSWDYSVEDESLDLSEL